MRIECPAFLQDGPGHGNTDDLAQFLLAPYEMLERVHWSSSACNLCGRFRKPVPTPAGLAHEKSVQLGGATFERPPQSIAAVAWIQCVRISRRLSH